MTESEKWILGCTIVMAFAAIGALVVAIIALNKKTETQISPQPLAVELVKELHEQFAGLEPFEKHVEHNTARHAQLFASVERVEREGRAHLEAATREINGQRQQTMEKIASEFTFIRENLAEIKSRLKHLEEKK